jgi:chromosome condensin MukBEF ATPase and DNA-binding subunit MukB
MNEDTVRRAVAQLRAQGDAPTVRKVHRLIGGSFRDLARHLQRLLPPAAERMVTAATTPESPRPMGEIAAAQEHSRVAEAHAHALRSQYQAALARLHALQQASPPPRQEDLSPCARDVQELAARLDTQERAVQLAAYALHGVQDRADTLAHRLPGLRRQRALAQVEAQHAQEEAARRVEATQERVAAWSREIAQTQAELARLTGQVHT